MKILKCCKRNIVSLRIIVHCREVSYRLYLGIDNDVRLISSQVNNVGANFRKPTIEYTAEVYSEIMAINLDSAYHLCQLTHPLLKASGMGSIVFISSIAGVVSLGTGSVYAASKGGSYHHSNTNYLFNLLVVKGCLIKKTECLLTSDVFSCNHSAYKKLGLWMGKRWHKEQLCCSCYHQYTTCWTCNVLFYFIYSFILELVAFLLGEGFNDRITWMRSYWNLC